MLRKVALQVKSEVKQEVKRSMNQLHLKNLARIQL